MGVFKNFFIGVKIAWFPFAKKTSIWPFPPKDIFIIHSLNFADSSALILYILCFFSWVVY